MKSYTQEMELYFELKNTPESSRESYWRRVQAFLETSLDGAEFIRRFLMHVLPKGFVKIRHYGILANRNKKTKFELCRKLSFSPTYKPKYEGLTTVEILCLLVGKDVTVCPVCREGKLKHAHSFCPGSSP